MPLVAQTRRKVVVVVANRCGEEGEARYAGTSWVGVLGGEGVGGGEVGGEQVGGEGVGGERVEGEGVGGEGVDGGQVGGGEVGGHGDGERDDEKTGRHDEALRRGGEVKVYAIAGRGEERVLTIDTEREDWKGGIWRLR